MWLQTHILATAQVGFIMGRQTEGGGGEFCGGGDSGDW